MRNSVVTTEMCSKYHPDKACDQVSDAILTECLRLDPTSKVACETLWKGETVVLAGEITTSAEIDYEKIVREVADSLNYKVSEIKNLITTQSSEIHNAVVKEDDEVGAGDQGIMWGYACNDASTDYLPIGLWTANRVIEAIEEKVAIAKSRMSGKTKICCTRYGNVMCSRGSVIPLWIDQIKAGNPITVTEPNMTRFIMSLEEAVDLVLFAFEHGENGDLLIKKAPACTIQTQAEAVCELFGGRKEDIKVIGIRHGEKMYETLLTNEECAKAVDMGDFYRVPADNRGLNYDKYFKEGNEARNTLTEFNSNNTSRLNLQETIDTIAKLEYIQGRLAEDK